MSIELKQAAEKALVVLGSATSFMSRKARDQHESVVAELRTAIQQAEAKTDEPVAWLDEMLADTKEVFDANGTETPQVVRDVIEYVASWITVYNEKRHPAPGVPEKLTVDPSGVSGTADEGYVAGWNACRAAIQQAESEPVAWRYQPDDGLKFPGFTQYEAVAVSRGRSGTVIPLYTHPAPGVPDDVVRDAERWRVSELISEAALKHPDSRTEAENTAFNAYRAAFSSGNSYASCIDAAMLTAAQAQKGQP